MSSYPLERSIENTLLAIGRLDEALRDDDLREAWLTRSRVQAAADWATVEGHGISRENLLLAWIEAPAPLQRDWGACRYALALLRHLGAVWDDSEIEREIDEAVVSNALELLRKESKRRSALMAVAWAAIGWLRSGGDRAGFRLAVPAFFTEMGVTRVPCPALLPLALPRSTEPIDEWIGRFLAAERNAAERALRDLHELARTWAEWRGRVANRRRHSRLPHLVDLCVAMPMMTPRLAADRLGSSVRGASLLLDELVALGILREVTARKTWRLFVAGDLNVGRQRARRTGQQRTIGATGGVLSSPPFNASGQRVSAGEDLSELIQALERQSDHAAREVQRLASHQGYLRAPAAGKLSDD